VRTGRLRSFRFLHFAAHDESDPRTAYRSSLILAPDADPTSGPEAADPDGVITAEEIARTWDPQRRPGNMPPEFIDCTAAMHADWWRDLTFCVWRRHSATGWHRGKIGFPDHPDPDGSEFLLSAFDGRPETYHAWAEDYYEPCKFSLGAVSHIFKHRPLTEEVIRALNPERPLEDLDEEVRQIGYPGGRTITPQRWSAEG